MRLEDLPGDSCLVCGASLDGMYVTRVFCSKRCRATYFNGLRSEAAAEARARRTCAICGIAVQGKTAQQIYCSLKCRAEGKKRHPRSCLRCGVAFLTSTAVDAKCCSLSCAASLRDNSAFVPPRKLFPRACIWCATEYQPTRAARKYCSASCAARHRIAKGVPMPSRWEARQSR